MTRPLRHIAAALALVGLALASQAPAAEGLPKAEAPVLVTSLGQSLDAFQVQLSLGRAGVEFAYDPLADVDQLADKKTLFLAVGASLKGFGDAGIRIEDEIARAGRLLDAAQTAGILIVVLHVGGEERRDNLSNQLIEIAAPRARALIVREDSDGDGLFTRIAETGGIPMLVFGNVLNLRRPFQEMFADGPGS